MTGGSLPAMIWQPVMTYAHQGIELKNIAGVAPNATAPAVPPKTPVAGADKNAAPPPALRPTVLTRRGTDVLVRIERLMEDATRALGPSSGEVSALPSRPDDAASGAFASATSGSARGAARGN
jgi:penicillin-binding protein 1A